MYLALVYYPEIKDEVFQSFRKKYDPFFDLLPAHVTVVFPVPETIGLHQLIKHINDILLHWKPFDAHFINLDKTWDHWLLLTPKEGYSEIVGLHDELYSGILAKHLRKDLPFTPHIGLGLFSREHYNFNRPDVKLTFDDQRFNVAKNEFLALNFELWCNIDKLTLVSVNSGFSECFNVMEFELKNHEI